jgi:hypothetical protein
MSEIFSSKDPARSSEIWQAGASAQAPHQLHPAHRGGGGQAVTASGLVEIGVALGTKGSDLLARAEQAAGTSIRLPKVSKG